VDRFYPHRSIFEYQVQIFITALIFYSTVITYVSVTSISKSLYYICNLLFMYCILLLQYRVNFSLNDVEKNFHFITEKIYFFEVRNEYLSQVSYKMSFGLQVLLQLRLVRS
jgi:hypothetical protein